MAMNNISKDSYASFEDLSIEFWNEDSWNDEKAFFDSKKNLSPEIKNLSQEIKSAKLQNVVSILSQKNFSSSSTETPSEDFYKEKVGTNRRRVAITNNPIKASALIIGTEKNQGLLEFIEINNNSNKNITNSIKKDIQVKSNKDNSLKSAEVGIITKKNNSLSKDDLYLFHEGECAHSRSLEEKEIIEEIKLTTIEQKEPIEQSPLASHSNKKASNKKNSKRTRKKSSHDTAKKISPISDVIINNSSQKKT